MLVTKKLEELRQQLIKLLKVFLKRTSKVEVLKRTSYDL